MRHTRHPSISLALARSNSNLAGRLVQLQSCTDTLPASGNETTEPALRAPAPRAAHRCMGRRSAKRAAAAATDAASDGKKPKPPRVFRISATIVGPENVSPVPLVLDAATESKRAARQAEEAATITTQYLDTEEHRELFAKRFEAAVASACAKGGPVTLSKVITAMTKATGKVKITKRLKEKWCCDGFARDLWQISRHVPRQGLVAFPKGSSMPSEARAWRFSPSPAASRPPLAELPCEPSPSSSAGCVVC